MAKNTQQTSDSYRILIIEDDPVFRQVCQLTAAQLGNTLVEVADSAERAIELIGCKTYDLLILDVLQRSLGG